MEGPKQVACPSCGNSNVQTARMVWELGSGVQSTSGMAVGAYMTRQGGVAPTVHSINSETRTQTSLAARYVPPITDRADSKRNQLTIGIVVALLGTIIALFTWGNISANPGYNPPRAMLFLASALAGVGGIIAWIAIALFELPNAEAQDAADRRRAGVWHKTWVCLACGNDWVKE